MLLIDLPVGRQDLLVLLQKLIRYIQIKVRRRMCVMCKDQHAIILCPFSIV